MPHRVGEKFVVKSPPIAPLVSDWGLVGEYIDMCITIPWNGTEYIIPWNTYFSECLKNKTRHLSTLM